MQNIEIKIEEFLCALSGYRPYYAASAKAFTPMRGMWPLSGAGGEAAAIGADSPQRAQAFLRAGKARTKSV